jgi:putative oxidoreductase
MERVLTSSPVVATEGSCVEREYGSTSVLARYGTLVGRILLAAIFLMSGFDKFAQHAGTVAYAQAAGLPLADVAIYLAGAVELLGALSLILGFRARWGALALVLFLVPATLLFHNFWAFSGMDQQLQLGNFMKNLALIGGLLTVFVYGAGPLSLDARGARRR